MEQESVTDTVTSPPHRHPIPVRLLFAGLGTLFVLGIFLPVLPTTPFLLLAAACYTRSSRRIYHWLLQHRHFGPLIRELREHRSMPYRAKRKALLLIVLSFAVPSCFSCRDGRANWRWASAGCCWQSGSPVFPRATPQPGLGYSGLFSGSRL
ncbi:MAG: YbaN family protein [Thiobacillus sp.]